MNQWYSLAILDLYELWLPDMSKILLITDWSIWTQVHCNILIDFQAFQTANLWTVHDVRHCMTDHASRKKSFVSQMLFILVWFQRHVLALGGTHLTLGKYATIICEPPVFYGEYSTYLNLVILNQTTASMKQACSPITYHVWLLHKTTLFADSTPGLCFDMVPTKLTYVLCCQYILTYKKTYLIYKYTRENTQQLYLYI